MIGRLRGILLEREPSNIIVDVGGVGYRVFVPPSAFAGVEGEEVDLFIHTEVREDMIQLFGFHTKGQREVFRALLSVQGIGPMTSLAVLSGLTMEELSSAIHSGNSRVLCSIPRIGKKTAERICLELGEKILKICDVVPGGTQRADKSPDFADALLALENLGYKPTRAKRAVERAKEEAPEGPIEVWIRLALQYLKH